MIAAIGEAGGTGKQEKYLFGREKMEVEFSIILSAFFFLICYYFSSWSYGMGDTYIGGSNRDKQGSPCLTVGVKGAHLILITV